MFQFQLKVLTYIDLSPMVGLAPGFDDKAIILNRLGKKHHFCDLVKSSSTSSSCLQLTDNYYFLYRALSTQQPPYLTSLLHLSNIPRQLRSSISQLFVPKTKFYLSKYAFSVAVPWIWNELLITLKTSETSYFPKKKLKTYLFKISTINHHTVT